MVHEMPEPEEIPKMNCTSCTPASWENQGSDWDLSGNQSDMVAKLQLPPASKKGGFSWMGWHHKGDTASRICRTIFNGRNGTDHSRMQHQMEEMWNKAKNKDRVGETD